MPRSQYQHVVDTNTVNRVALCVYLCQHAFDDLLDAQSAPGEKKQQDPVPVLCFPPGGVPEGEQVRTTLEPLSLRRTSLPLLVKAFQITQASADELHAAYKNEVEL